MVGKHPHDGQIQHIRHVRPLRMPAEGAESSDDPPVLFGPAGRHGRRPRAPQLGASSRSAPRRFTSWGEHRTAQLDQRLPEGPEWEANDLVFSTDGGRPLGQRRVHGHFKAVLACADLPTIRPHGLRHTYATLHLEQGENPPVVQERLGHSSARSAPTLTSRRRCTGRQPSG